MKASTFSCALRAVLDGRLRREDYGDVRLQKIAAFAALARAGAAEPGMLGQIGMAPTEMPTASLADYIVALGKVPGVEIVTPHFFNEFTIRTRKPGAEVIDRLVDAGVIGGVPAARLFPDSPDLHDLIIVAATEMTSPADRDSYVSALTKVLS